MSRLPCAPRDHEERTAQVRQSLDRTPSRGSRPGDQPGGRAPTEDRDGETMPAVSVHYSSRVLPPDPEALELAIVSRTAGTAPALLNDTNPTRHHLGPSGLSGPAARPYDADPRGSLSLRQQVARVTGYVDAQRTYLTTSTSQAYTWVFSLLCDPGESVAVPAPGYPLLDSLAQLTGVRTVRYRLAPEDGWRIDLPALEASLEDADAQGHPVRALVVINPGNPTGAYTDQGRELARLARRRGLALIADEVFYPFALAEHPPTARLSQDVADLALCLTLDGLSKSLAAPQLKLAWIHVSGPHDEVEEVMARLDVLADDVLPVGAAQEAVVSEVLTQMPTVQDRVRRRLRDNLAVVTEVLAANPGCPVSALPVDGGWSVLLRLPHWVDEDVLALRCAERGLAIQPGYYFDMPFPAFTPVSLLPEPEQTRARLLTLLDVVAALNP